MTSLQCAAVLACGLLLVSCESTNRVVASNQRKFKRPPAQNVSSYEGGEMIKRMQQGGGSGINDSSGNFIGGGH